MFALLRAYRNAAESGQFEVSVPTYHRVAHNDADEPRTVQLPPAPPWLARDVDLPPSSMLVFIPDVIFPAGWLAEAGLNWIRLHDVPVLRASNLDLVAQLVRHWDSQYEPASGPYEPVFI